MAAYFFDSSALVKRYEREVGTAWVITLFALATTPLTLISADDDLNAAAAAEGLAVDNPNNHP